MTFEELMLNTEDSDVVILRKMETDLYMSLPRYEHQRPEDLRLSMEHMKGALVSVDQEVVGAVQLPNGNICKIDGHSRTKAWEAGQLEKPDHVFVMVYLGLTEKEIDKLYDVKTSKSTAAKPAEEIHTANSRAKFEPTSRFCKQSWLYALKLAVGGKVRWKEIGEEDGSVAHYRNVFMKIDLWDIEVDGEKYSTGVRAAMLSTHDANPERWDSFWIAYRDGSTTNPAVNMAISGIDSARNNHNSGFNTNKVMGFFEAAFQMHCSQ